jgi:hypothetical protein
MKTTFTVAALTGLLSTASAQYFGLTSARSASAIHYQTVSASGQSIWLNKKTASFCPESVEDIGACPPGNFTTFAGGEDTLSMGVVVPGGQQVYIEPDTGALKYTQAHSVVTTEGAIQTGWTVSPGNGFGILSNSNGPLIACPADDGSYQVFIGLECVDFDSACLSFDALTSNVTDAGAWQYS